MAEELPIFAAEHLGCLNWGSVNGKAKTNDPWVPKAGSPPPKFSQLDLCHTELTPYDPAELAFHDTLGRANAAAE